MQSRARSRGRLVLAAVGAVAAGGMVARAADIPLRRDLSAYFIFAETRVQLKNITVNDACNIGVNCARPNSSSTCGDANFSDPTLADGSQVASDSIGFSQQGGSVFQVFKNTGNLANVVINHPGMQPDGSDILNPLPILGNLDGDANASCGPNCTVDFGDLEAACGFPAVFPTCDNSKAIFVNKDSDCIPPILDSNPGNQICDLAPGVYGSLVALDNSKIQFAGGDYTFCDVQLGKQTETQASAATVINVPSPGGFGISNLSKFGRLCGDFTVRVKDGGDVTFGKGVTINAKVCAPESHVTLGHGNTLTGQFVGNDVSSDVENQGFCCASGACTCFDVFTPTSAHVGDTITLTGACDLTQVTSVKLNCGGPDIPAVIDSKSASELKFKVPAGAAGSCSIRVDSSAGTFTSSQTLTVN